MDICKHPIKSTFTTLRLLCRTMAGNNVYYITITSPQEVPDKVSWEVHRYVSPRFNLNLESLNNFNVPFLGTITRLLARCSGIRMDFKNIEICAFL